MKGRHGGGGSSRPGPRWRGGASVRHATAPHSPGTGASAGRVDIPSVGEVAPHGVEKARRPVFVVRRNCSVFWGAAGYSCQRARGVTVLSPIDTCNVPSGRFARRVEPRPRSPEPVLEESSKSPQVLKSSSEVEDFCGHQRTVTDTGGRLKVQLDAYKWRLAAGGDGEPACRRDSVHPLVRVGWSSI
jgi:hypothetical protein